MKTIWKYTLAVDDVQELEIPIDYKILSVQVQDGTPCLWALVDPSKEKRLVRIVTIGTGNPVTSLHEPLGDFIGTYQLLEGRFVGHVFRGK